MFGNKTTEVSKAKSKAIPNSANGPSLNTVVTGSIVEGAIRSESDIRIDGVIRGQLHCDAKVIVGPHGRIEGEVRCQHAMIEGHIDGDLYVSGLLNVRETAVITGNVSTEKLIVQAGATFNVSCDMGSGRNKNHIQQEAKDTENSNSITQRPKIVGSTGAKAKAG